MGTLDGKGRGGDRRLPGHWPRDRAAAGGRARGIEADLREPNAVVMGVNARLSFVTIRHAAREMRDGGRIINISTLNATRPGPGSAVYAICPGVTDTDLLWHTNPGVGPEQIARLTPGGLPARSSARLVAWDR